MGNMEQELKKYGSNKLNSIDYIIVQNQLLLLIYNIHQHFSAVCNHNLFKHHKILEVPNYNDRRQNIKSE